MQTFPIVFLSLAVPVSSLVTDLSSECNGCYLDGKCFCNHTVGLFRTLYECKEIMCVEKTYTILKWYCKDNKGNCLEHGEHRVGVINNQCVTFTCIVWRQIPRMGVRRNFICTLEHVYSYWKNSTHKEIDQC
ncbi:uncharacterized protein LOC106869804 [Octopus bimaculoides]|uniref:Uncharacterized protein n=1 Tax=Octopus bimaculoides TaxID=37653 RepID=A0A0L8HM80_OCTBM|nr:uncharacterized protein LOC106869804 [Octopus bimaculoides]XP_052824916.1 uncharacterized protein LOC106869804 [Octopus bimaculoides]XP_052824917.1 uncharacterized protein LOC106869804 [Octopus bimaculoides]|eukprot:XP_014771150.1 PREDICTED: uncharacterized protein LOC106869804 [Octopus bimaculoides]